MGPMDVQCPICSVGPGYACVEGANEVPVHFAREAVSNQPKRVPVTYRYDAILPDFLKRLAMIGHYANEKYGSWDQYMTARLEGDKDPLNHIYEHLRQYQMGEAYDHFDGDLRWHLVAVAYNAMMSFFYHGKYGFKAHPSANIQE